MISDPRQPQLYALHLRQLIHNFIHIFLLDDQGGQPGHVASQCTQFAKRLCHICKQPGHMMADCPQRRGSQPSSNRVQDNGWGGPLAERVRNRESRRSRDPSFWDSNERESRLDVIADEEGPWQHRAALTAQLEEAKRSERRANRFSGFSEDGSGVVRQEETPKDLANMVCYRCQEMGHIARDCPTKSLK
ncbi:hypothetical protein CPB86DRAFT_811033 [Serendipita vermifera]|nr:hypothetical protein CPB86DRAFT_811033 [Serendipita vermifera]